MKQFIATLGLVLSLFASSLARAAEPYGIGLEGFAYPYPVAMLAVPGEGETLRLAYMDVKPTGPANGPQHCAAERSPRGFRGFAEPDLVRHDGRGIPRRECLDRRLPNSWREMRPCSSTMLRPFAGPVGFTSI